MTKSSPQVNIMIDRLQLFSEFYKEYNIDEIAKHYKPLNEIGH